MLLPPPALFRATTTRFGPQRAQPLFAQLRNAHNKRPYKMGKKSRAVPEESLRVPPHPSLIQLSDEASAPSGPVHVPAIIDTHTHLLSTFSAYRQKYPDGKYTTLHEFLRGFYSMPSELKTRVTDMVDVWCEAPVMREWKEIADSALTLEQRTELWGGINYWFVIGVHPHNAKNYNEGVEKDLIEAASHPRCVGMGEMGLDYHYDNSPRDVQREVLIRQLKCAVSLNKPLTIHTREADEDIFPILKEHVPKDHRIHIHCFTDTPQLAKSLLDYFPNLYIGITGVITYATNLNTSVVIGDMVRAQGPMRILLETDAPYMIPSNLTPQTLGLKPGTRIPFSHSAMIPWTAEFVAGVASKEQAHTMEDVLRVAENNARTMYSL